MNSLLYRNAELLRNSIKGITYLRTQNFYSGLKYVTRVLSQIETLMDDWLNYSKKCSDVTFDINYLNEMLMELLQAQTDKDYILLADLYELKLNPYILEIQQCIMSNNEISFNHEQYKEIFQRLRDNSCNFNNVDCGEFDISSVIPNEKYSIEYTAGGLATLSIIENGRKFYLHSNNIIAQEAWNIAREWYSEDKTEYIIYGLGLGYHILELLEMDETLEVKVYENDLKMIHLACAYGCMDDILKHSKRFMLIYDPDFTRLNKMLENLNKEAGYYIYYPSLRNIDDKNIKEFMEDYFVSYSSVINQRRQLNNNFKKNILKHDDYVDSLKEKFRNKDLYIIAAGPSLDKNYFLLKNRSADSIILSTGTVLKKLVKAGIEPDYVIITDGNEGAFKQVESFEVNIPLLFLSTVNHNVTNSYSGKKYLICQNGFEPAEEFAAKNGYSLYHTGGSVSTTALDVGIQLECRRIIFLGLDLAYTNDLNHASDTQEFGTVDISDCRMVEDINGNMIKTGKNLDIYRKWIERRISDVKNIEFINATEGGAFIKGMKLCKLTDVL